MSDKQCFDSHENKRGDETTVTFSGDQKSHSVSPESYLKTKVVYFAVSSVVFEWGTKSA